MAATIEAVERGIFHRKDPVTGVVYAPLWIRYEAGGKSIPEPTGTTDIREARKIRAQRIAEAAKGTPVVARSLTVGDLLDQLLAYHDLQGHAYAATVRGHVAAIKAARGEKGTLVGEIRAKDFTSEDAIAMQKAWQAEGRITNATINKRCSSLRTAFTLAKRKKLVADVPYIGDLKHVSPRGLYIKPEDRIAISQHLWDHVALLLDFAAAFSIRKGQLSRTFRTWVDRARATITWPPVEEKSDEAHVIPLDDYGLAIIDRLLADGEKRPWCPYLFHGRRCAPGRKVHKKYGCIGDFKEAWDQACKAAGLPVGRKNGGYTFHMTRNTALTDMVASGRLSLTEAMHFSGHKDASVARRYNLGNIEALRERIAASREEIERLQVRGGGR